MKSDKEIVGTLLGFDDFVNMVLEDVTEYESTPEGRRITQLDQILLNGNHITMVSHDRRYSIHRSARYVFNYFFNNLTFVNSFTADQLLQSSFAADQLLLEYFVFYKLIHCRLYFNRVLVGSWDTN